MKLLHVIPTVNPLGGGPMEGVRQRGLRLLEMGHSVELVTLDDPGAPYLSAYPLPLHALGPTRSGYGYTPRLVPWLRAHARDYDAVVVNGLWQYHSFATWRALAPMGVPYHVFTHGMLDPWFKSTYPLKHFKKWLYWPWAEYRVLRDATSVLFTSEEERLQARQSFWLYKAREHVVAYGTAQPPQDGARLRELFLAAHPQLRGKRIVLFLSRIHEKKGCDLLVQAFARVACADPALHLVMAGPDQTSLLPRLQAMAAAASVADRVSWPGMLQGDMKWGAFYASEVFALPSHQENFGIAVAEALGCGLPVLISDKVNTWREIDELRSGLVGADTAAGVERLLRDWLALSGAERSGFANQARSTFTARFSVDAMASDLIAATQALNTVVQAHGLRRFDPTS
jgi:glycosyltransferase involved in cell wall biosynthesis